MATSKREVVIPNAIIALTLNALGLGDSATFFFGTNQLPINRMEPMVNINVFAVLLLKALTIGLNTISKPNIKNTPTQK